MTHGDGWGPRESLPAGELRTFRQPSVPGAPTSYPTGELAQPRLTSPSASDASKSAWALQRRRRRRHLCSRSRCVRGGGRRGGGTPTPESRKSKSRNNAGLEKLRWNAAADASERTRRREDARRGRRRPAPRSPLPDQPTFDTRGAKREKKNPLSPNAAPPPSLAIDVTTCRQRTAMFCWLCRHGEEEKSARRFSSSPPSPRAATATRRGPRKTRGAFKTQRGRRWFVGRPRRCRYRKAKFKQRHKFTYYLAPGAHVDVGKPPRGGQRRPGRGFQGGQNSSFKLGASGGGADP